jgi:hypothetical protein
MALKECVHVIEFHDQKIALCRTMQFPDRFTNTKLINLTTNKDLDLSGCFCSNLEISRFLNRNDNKYRPESDEQFDANLYICNKKIKCQTVPFEASRNTHCNLVFNNTNGTIVIIKNGGKILVYDLNFNLIEQYHIPEVYGHAFEVTIISYGDDAFYISYNKIFHKGSLLLAIPGVYDVKTKFDDYTVYQYPDYYIRLAIQSGSTHQAHKYLNLKTLVESDEIIIKRFPYHHLVENRGVIELRKKPIDDADCIVCFEKNLKRVVFVPCGHANVCKTCIVTVCPTCRVPITQIIDLFL